MKWIKMDKKIKRKVIVAIVITFLVVITLGVTYAYFAGQIGSGASIDINITSQSTDQLIFIPGTELNIEASVENFYYNAGNLSSITTTSAKLTSSPGGNPAYTYNAFFIIDSNDYEYTTEDNKVELLLNVLDPEKNEIKSIPGLHYVCSNETELCGFDITESYGSFAIFNDYAIATTSEIIQEWEVTVTYINLDTDQMANEGKTLTGRIYLTPEDMEVYTLPMINTLTVTVNNGISLNVSATTSEGTAPVAAYYYAIDEVEVPISFMNFNNNRYEKLGRFDSYYETNINSYHFEGLTPEKEYTISSYVKDTNGFTSPVYQSDITTNSYEYASVNEVEITNVTETSIGISVNASNGQSNVSKYYYSIDNGVSYEELSTNTKTFTELTPGTNYFIKVYVSDELDYNSVTYDITQKTNYTNPSVTNVVTSNVALSSMTLIITGLKGTNNINKYYYSFDNGITYEESTSNVINKSGLIRGTTYNVKVYVKDILNYDSEEYSITVTTKSETLGDRIIANNGGTTAIIKKGKPNFATVATTNMGMYATPDDYGTSYYFRGAVNNNWVKFAGMYWRIIRVNGDGSVRMIYSGSTAPTSAQAVVMTGTGTQITISGVNTFQFNNGNGTLYETNDMTGYMYTSGEIHGLGTNSNAKTQLDNWFISNLVGYTSKLADNLFCNDRNPSTSKTTVNGSGGTGKTITYWAGYIRLSTNKSPILTCSIKTDAFTVSDTTKGNGALTNPIGLITADEIAMAGAYLNGTNYNYYLYTGQKYVSMTPFWSYKGTNFYEAALVDVHTKGELLENGATNLYGLRPVISLNPNDNFTGSGLWNDPYIIS